MRKIIINNNTKKKEIDNLLKLYKENNFFKSKTFAKKFTVNYPKEILGWQILSWSNFNLGLFVDSINASLKLLEIEPNSIQIISQIIRSYQILGDKENIRIFYKKLINLHTDNADLLFNFSNFLRDIGDYNEAIIYYKKSIILNPVFSEAQCNLGAILLQHLNFNEAEFYLRQAKENNAKNVEAINNLASLLRQTGKLDEAKKEYQYAISLKNDSSYLHHNLGNVLQDLGKLNEAIISYRKAIELNLDFHKSYINLGSCLQKLGRMKEAVESYKIAISLSPVEPTYFSNLLFCLSHMEDVDPQELFKLHCDFGERFEAPLRSSWPIHTNNRDPNRCLKVGFVSGDFRNHAVANFIEPILECLSRSKQFSLHGYYNFPVSDETTHKIKNYFLAWNIVLNLTDQELSNKIIGDEIDILIDLSSHTAYSRLLTFARKPAPIQISWIGYPGTTGLSAIDYLIADKHYLPYGEFEELFVEKIIHLPAVAIFSPIKNSPEVNELPAKKNGYITFGSFNRTNKITRSVIALWSELLRAVPTSRMLLGAMPSDSESNIWLEWFREEGIRSERLEFHPKKSTVEYLKLHHQVDLCLDTFPYNGGTTSWYAVWMGIPTLTLTGKTIMSRTGATVMGTVGLGKFIAKDKNEFIEKGIEWSSNILELAFLRQELRERFIQSPAGQPELVTDALSSELRKMWLEWCKLKIE